EYFVRRRRDGGDETLASFARRRLGREVFERIVQPLVGGIYTADPEKLSLEATLPRFLEMERRWGSLTRAARQPLDTPGEEADASASGVRYGLFMTPREGLSSLVEAVAARLPEGAVRTSAPVESIRHDSSGEWTVRLTGSASEPRVIHCEGAIIC